MKQAVNIFDQLSFSEGEKETKYSASRKKYHKNILIGYITISHIGAKANTFIEKYLSSHTRNCTTLMLKKYSFDIENPGKKILVHV